MSLVRVSSGSKNKSNKLVLDLKNINHFIKEYKDIDDHTPIKVRINKNPIKKIDPND
jgi:hypothetical protein